MTHIPVTKKKSVTARHCCFTAWNKPQYNETKMRYMCYAVETTPTTGKIHYQGYVEFYDAHRYSGMQKLLGTTDTSFHPREGTQEQAIQYCSGPYTTTTGKFKPLNPTFVFFGSLTNKKPKRAKTEERELTEEEQILEELYTVGPNNITPTPLRQCYRCLKTPACKQLCSACKFAMIFPTI